MKKLKTYINFIIESNSMSFLGIPLGEEIDKGTTSIVFEVANDITKVIKINFAIYYTQINISSKFDYTSELSDLNDYLGETMKKYPDIFARVFQHGPGYVVMEKLDTHTAQQEFSMMEAFYNDHFYDTNTDIPFDMNFDKDEGFPALKMLINCNVNEVSELARKWLNFFIMVKTETGYNWDYNNGNFGYKDGKLKMCDL